MEKKEKKYRESAFNRAIKIRRKQHEWIFENKDTKTGAGFLDKIINYYKKQNEQKRNSKMERGI